MFNLTTGDRRPRLNFSGQWMGANLVMDDEGSIAGAFLPDGNLSPDSKVAHSNTGAMAITFHETPWEWFGGDCGNSGS